LLHAALLSGYGEHVAELDHGQSFSDGSEVREAGDKHVTLQLVEVDGVAKIGRARFCDLVTGGQGRVLSPSWAARSSG